MSKKTVTLSYSNEKGFTRHIEKIIICLFFLCLLMLILYPVHDPDVFWHLKTGEWIWQHRALPETDPFSFTVTGNDYDDSIRPATILKGYWLSQIIIYGLHNLFGMYGIIMFRSLIYLGTIFLLYFWMRQKKINPVTALFFLIPACLVVFTFGGERPNTLSYLIALTLVYVADEFVTAGKRKGLLMPLLMLFWPLMHGGFLIGEIILGIYFITMIYRLLKKDIPFKPNIVRTVILPVSMAIPFLYKGARYSVWMMLGISGSLSEQKISEHVNPFVYAAMGDYSCLAIIGFMILCIVLVIRRFSIEHILMALIFLSLSLSAVRYIPFLVIVMTPIVAFHWSSRPTFDIHASDNKILRYSMYVTLLFSVFFIGQAALRNSFFLKGTLSPVYPEDAVRFIKTVKPGGNMFNYYDWGGYLIYRLYPEKKVFIDGRNLSHTIFEKYYEIVDGSKKISGTQPAWKSGLDKYNIEIILLPVYNQTYGVFTMIVKRLIDDPAWSLVFMGDKNPSLIFVKNSEPNRDIIKRYSMAKERAYERALKDLENEFMSKGHWRGDLQLGLINIYLGRYAAAKKFLEKALEENSNLKQTNVIKLLEQVNNKGELKLDEKELDAVLYL